MVQQYAPYYPQQYYPQGIDYYGGRVGPQLQASYPAFHVLSKANGAVVTATWSVRNDGTANGFATLVVAVGLQAGAFSAVATIAPGATVSLSATRPRAAPAAGAALASVVDMDERTSAGGFVRQIARHTFTVNTPAAAPILVAVGDPSIA